MTIPVNIQHGSLAITAQLHSVPRAGEQIRCSFPSAGIPMLYLEVESVIHHQASDFDGKECAEPFAIIVTTKADPAHKKENDAAVSKASRGEG